MMTDTGCGPGNSAPWIARRAALRTLAVLWLVLASAWAHGQGVYYRFAAEPPSVTCDTSVMGKPSAHNTTTPVEWSNIPAGATFNAYSVLNGLATPAGNYPAPTGSGSQLYAPFTVVGPSFPFTGGIRYDLLVQNRVVYQSSLIFSCTAAGVPGTLLITNAQLSTSAGIPTLSQWGLLALVLAVLVLGARVVQRRISRNNAPRAGD